jgi:hypothetical protein
MERGEPQVADPLDRPAVAAVRLRVAGDVTGAPGDRLAQLADVQAPGGSRPERRVEDVRPAERHAERLDPLGVLVQQEAEVGRRPVRRRDREQHDREP